MASLASLPTGRAHLAYREPPATRTSPPRCLPARATAEELQAAITALAGLDARARRTCMITTCTCGAAS